MNQSSEKVLKYLTGNESIEAVTVEDLQRLVDESPYFPVTQFLLVKKLKSESEDQYLSQAQKTALYFSNPYWLNYQLSENELDQAASDLELTTISTADNENNFSTSFAQPQKELIPLSSNTTITEEDLTNTTNLVEDTSHQKDIRTTETQNATIDEVVSPANEEELPAIAQVEEEQAALTRTPDKEAEEFISHLDTDTVASKFVEEDVSFEPPVADSEVTEFKEEMAGAAHTFDDATEQFLVESENQLHKEDLSQDDEHERMFRNIKAMLDASSEEASADTQNAVIPMDPYYTIDYFASQGIKLELDQNPQDQLGQHLKKFTQWLKHMKKLGPEDATEVINRTESDADIQQFADSSNTVREVVTEAMALVLEKQGKKDKAIELYNKLSFLNPDKRAYFADKIKNLKGF